jgi:hypothetical protein
MFHRAFRSVTISGSRVKKRDESDFAAKDGEGESASVAHFIFLNACLVSQKYDAWPLIYKALAD